MLAVIVRHYLEWATDPWRALFKVENQAQFSVSMSAAHPYPAMVLHVVFMTTSIYFVKAIRKQKRA